MNRKYVLKNRRRFCIFVMLVTITLSCIFFAATVNGADTDSNAAYTTVIVERGDTIWNLAQKYNKEGDIRQYIHKIKEANNLADSMIVEGDILKLPA